MFDLHDTQRLTFWKQFRDTLETSDTPFDDVAKFWSLAPFVSPFLDHSNPESWPDPWHLVLDNKLDDLAICLGMLYTLQLTQRFIGCQYEIHMSMLPDEKENRFFLVIDKKNVLNYVYGASVDFDQIKDVQTSLIYTVKKLK